MTQVWMEKSGFFEEPGFLRAATQACDYLRLACPPTLNGTAGRMPYDLRCG